MFSTSSSSVKEVVARGISGREFTAENIKTLFAKTEETTTTTLYRAVTGSEGKGSLFLTDKLEYAKTYLKDAKDGVIQVYKVSNDGLKTFINEGVIKTLQGTNPSGVSGMEYYIENRVIVNEILNSAVK